MYTEYNFYCDEALHLPNDKSKIMILGGIWAPKKECRIINENIRAIKEKHGIKHEMKWVKLSEAKKEAYLELIDYFFNCKDLHFRVLIIDNKDAIDHEAYNQTHDDWYYKMYFRLIKTILEPEDRYNIYLDIKDSKSKTKIANLKKVLSNSRYDFSSDIISNMQVIRSNEVEIMQIVDVLIGAMAYYSRGLSRMSAKNEIIQMIKDRTGYSLSKNTLYRESKFNIFHLQLEENGRV